MVLILFGSTFEKQMLSNDITILFGEKTDLPEIVGIYNQAIRSGLITGDTEEFKPEDRIDWFNSFQRDSYPIYVAKTDSKVVGYCTLSPYRCGRKALDNVADISYYVDDDFHRRGIGKALIQYAIDDGKRIKKENLLATLIETNTPSICLLEKLNFRQWGYYPKIFHFEGKKYSHLIYGLKIEQ